MVRNLVMCGLMLSGAAFSVGCTPTLDWREVSAPEWGHLKAMLPCQPEKLVREVTVPPVTQSVSMGVWSCQAGDATWAITAFNVQDVAHVGVAMDGLTQSMQSNLQAASEAVGVKEAVQVRALGGINVPGMTPNPRAQAWQLQAKRVDAWGRPLTMHVMTWHFSHGLRVFQASVSRAGAASEASSSQDGDSPFWGGFIFPS